MCVSDNYQSGMSNVSLRPHRTCISEWVGMDARVGIGIEVGVGKSWDKSGA